MPESNGLPWTQVAVHAALANYDALVERAQHVARLIYGIRFPRDAAHYFDISFPDPPYYNFEASYHYGSNDHSLWIPTEYLWESDDAVIDERERERITAEQQAKEAQRKAREAAEEAELEAQQRKTYERLKKKFEGD